MGANLDYGLPSEGEKLLLKDFPIYSRGINTRKLALRRWEMEKPGKSSSVMFMLTDGWNDVVARNGLNVGDHVEVWSFWHRSQLCLALITARN
ncbi:hypothetical protein CRG98_026414 [Punica granatum]|uniref:TF-B3 domain-containing protein n=1 Tax=Punica granatum TaxID=22663 RepID=A0A2I0JB21_PUNGR|nr:hypothetical protein CRG98_026414 [Punica granatum]